MERLSKRSKTNRDPEDSCEHTVKFYNFERDFHETFEPAVV